MFLFSDKAVKKIWKNLRQEFGKQLQKIIKSGDGAPEELHNDWPYFNQMLFLKDQFLPRKSYGSMKVSEGVDLRALEDDSDSTEQLDSFLERMRCV